MRTNNNFYLIAKIICERRCARGGRAGRAAFARPANPSIYLPRPAPSLASPQAKQYKILWPRFLFRPRSYLFRFVFLPFAELASTRHSALNAWRKPARGRDICRFLGSFRNVYLGIFQFRIRGALVSPLPRNACLMGGPELAQPPGIPLTLHLFLRVFDHFFQWKRETDSGRQLASAWIAGKCVAFAEQRRAPGCFGRVAQRLSRCDRNFPDSMLRRDRNMLGTEWIRMLPPRPPLISVPPQRIPLFF